MPAAVPGGRFGFMMLVALDLVRCSSPLGVLELECVGGGLEGWIGVKTSSEEETPASSCILRSLKRSFRVAKLVPFLQGLLEEY